MISHTCFNNVHETHIIAWTFKIVLVANNWQNSEIRLNIKTQGGVNLSNQPSHSSFSISIKMNDSYILTDKTKSIIIFELEIQE